MKRHTILRAASVALALSLVSCSSGSQDPPQANPELVVLQGTREITHGETISFGGVVVDTTKDLEITIENRGQGSLLLTGDGVAFAGTDAALFSISAPWTSPIEAGASMSFSIRFGPSSVGPKTATLCLTCNDEDEGSCAFSLEGECTAAPEPEICVRDPSSVEVASGGAYAFAATRSTQTADATFTIENSGSAALNLTNSPPVVITGANASCFTVTADPSSPIAASDSALFTIRFAPGTVGQKNAMATILSNDSSEGSYSIALSGLGVAPNIELWQGSTDIVNGTGSYGFASTPVGATRDVAFDIVNDGGYALALTGSPIVALGGADASQFSVSAQPSSATVAAMTGQVSFQLRFQPTSGGAKTATVSIANDDPDESPYTFSVTGTATVAPEMNVKQGGTAIADGGSYAFASTLHTNTTSVTFTIENIGTGALSLTGSPRVAIGGTDASMFTVASQPAATIAAGGSGTFTVDFTPTSTGTKGATVSIANDDSNENPYNFSISGVATEWHGFKSIAGSGSQILASSLAMSGTSLYVSYYDATNKRLMFAKSSDSGATWTAPAIVVDSASDLGKYNSISVYSTNVYLAYHDNTANSLMYIKSTDGGSTWPSANIVTVDTGGGAYCSLASNGNILHVSYFGGSSDLKYAGSSDGGSTWPGTKIKTVDSTGLVGTETSIAVSGYNVYISYQDNLSGYLRFAASADSGVTWATPATLDSSASVAWFGTSIAVSGTNLYLAYYDATSYDLKFLRSIDSGVTWGGIVSIDTAGDVGYYPSVAVSGSTIYIAYGDSSPYVKLAKSADSGATWPAAGISSIMYGFHGYGCGLRASGSRLFALISPGSSAMGLTLAKSLDGGATW